jgi:hypothetical protein
MMGGPLQEYVTPELVIPLVRVAINIRLLRYGTRRGDSETLMRVPHLSPLADPLSQRPPIFASEQP